MYLRVEENIVVNTKDIIGIFDMDNTTVSRLGRNFLAESQKNGLIINSTDDLPKSFVVAIGERFADKIRDFDHRHPARQCDRHFFAVIAETEQNLRRAGFGNLINF